MPIDSNSSFICNIRSLGNLSGQRLFSSSSHILYHNTCHAEDSFIQYKKQSSDITVPIITTLPSSDNEGITASVIHFLFLALASGVNAFNSDSKSSIIIRFQNTGPSGATLPKHAVVKDCKIEDDKGVNNAGVTHDALGIQIQGYENAEVTNNFIKDVIREKNADGCDACRGITVQDCHITNITNNYYTT